MTISTPSTMLCRVMQVLTMEWVDGARLNDKAAIDAMGLDSSKFVDTLVQCSLRQMLENGFFHADPHAGNLLAMPSGINCDSMRCDIIENMLRTAVIAHPTFDRPSCLLNNSSTPLTPFTPPSLCLSVRLL